MRRQSLHSQCADYRLGLVNSRRLGAADKQLLENIVGLTPEDVQSAWDYCGQHPAEIEDDIRVNEAD